MREITYIEIQNIAGGFSFASVGKTIGSYIGSLYDFGFNQFRSTPSTALSSSIGLLGSGLGGLLDVPIALFSGTASTTYQTAKENIINGFNSTISNLGDGFNAMLTTAN
ncbi:hypothetical protein [Commensalibacter oyaizuii]|uniref:Uncharacterized protein n=1 Tax=Commensalibacter oyaizuii TaxID=3043873 RepID=A0ABT6PYN4_9PROT|nr:hypothetical protein [Commensalibacter sp. TBRC 16381]MDI2089963.1 hypothetical protein [Commensalibacter sp. TBRC 16381]